MPAKAGTHEHRSPRGVRCDFHRVRVLEPTWRISENGPAARRAPEDAASTGGGRRPATVFDFMRQPRGILRSIFAKMALSLGLIPGSLPSSPGVRSGDHLSRGRILPPALTLGTPRDSDPREQDAAEYGGKAGDGDKFAISRGSPS